MNGQPLPFFTRPHHFAATFFAILLFLFYLMARFLAPFSTALPWAAVIAIALAPLYRNMVLIFKDRTRLAAT
jgi:predicted PurR-regulated permease PerM